MSWMKSVWRWSIMWCPIVVFLSACGGNNEDPGTSPSPNNTSEQPSDMSLPEDMSP